VSAAILIGLVLVLALLGSRLFAMVGFITLACFALFTDEAELPMILGRIITKVEGLTTKNVFLSIPFFVAAGTIMTRGGIAQRLTDLASALVGWMPGGLAVASVMACIVFAAISGSSPVTLVAVGAVMFPALLAAGYSKEFSVGILTSAGSLGCMIPPAIAMLIYAISVQGSAAVDPSDLFFAGLFPALFIAGLLALYSVWVGRSIPGVPFEAGRLWTAAKGAGWSLSLPVLVLGGIYGGVFTPTEAGAMAFAAAIAIAVVVHGDVPWRSVPAILVEAATLIGSLILIVVLAFGLNDFLAEVDAAGVIRSWVQGADLSAWQFMLLVNVILIVLGALMDSISATLVFAPILAPVAINHYGIDPIHFGVVFVVNMEIGYLAPPVATNLFVAAAIFRQPFVLVARAVLPTLGIICAALVALIYLPVLSLGPLNYRQGEPVWADFPWDPPAEATPTEEATGEPAPDAGEGRPLTMEELMKKAKEQSGAPSEAAPVPEEGRPLTMEELMKKAKEQAAAEEAAAAGAAPSEGAPAPQGAPAP